MIGVALVNSVFTLCYFYYEGHHFFLRLSLVILLSRHKNHTFVHVFAILSRIVIKLYLSIADWALKCFKFVFQLRSLCITKTRRLVVFYHFENY